MKMTLKDKLNDPKSEPELTQLMTRIYMEEVAREAVRREVRSLPDDILREMVDRVVFKPGVDVEDVKALLPAEGMTKGLFTTMMAIELRMPRSVAAELLDEALAKKVVRAFAQKSNAVLITHGVAPGMDWAVIFGGESEMRGPVIRDRVMVATGKSKPWVHMEIAKAVKDDVLVVVRKEGREQVLALAKTKAPAVVETPVEVVPVKAAAPVVPVKPVKPRYPDDENLPAGFEDWANALDYTDGPWGNMSVENGNRAWAEWQELREKERLVDLERYAEEMRAKAGRVERLRAMCGGPEKTEE